jgi:perosamine synthetase
LMCLELENKAQRDIFLKETNLAGVMTRPIWQLMHRLPMYKDCQRDAQVNAQFLEERIVNIPSSYRP